jgi:MOSC domain-containing protein YiiM
MTASIFQISRSNGGVPKEAVPEVMIRTAGLEGDWQLNRVHHGGPDRAVCLFPLELIQQLQSEGHPLVAGSVGENITTVGLNWTLVTPGTQLLLGDRVLLEVVSYTVPCRTIQGAFADHKFGRISQKTHPGSSRVYARVLAEGVVRVGDPVVMV